MKKTKGVWKGWSLTKSEGERENKKLSQNCKWVWRSELWLRARLSHWNLFNLVSFPFSNTRNQYCQQIYLNLFSLCFYGNSSWKGNPVHVLYRSSSFSICALIERANIVTAADLSGSGNYKRNSMHFPVRCIKITNVVLLWTVANMMFRLWYIVKDGLVHRRAVIVSFVIWRVSVVHLKF